MLVLALSSALATVPPAGLRGGFVRPSLSGPVEQIDVDGFRLHYTLQGRDAVSPVDVDGNDRPDLLDRIVEGLEQGRSSFAAEGWRGLLDDGEIGGTSAIDVYLRTLPVNGYATPVPIGSDHSCYIEIDPGLTTASGIATSVALHELHHCVQFRYDADLPSWLYESASTYEQYSHVTDPALDLALRLLYLDELSAMDTSLTTESGDNDPYTSFLWMKFWTELDGGVPELARLPALWEDLAGSGRWRAKLDRASRREFGLPLELTFLLYATWNSFACGADTGQLYDPAVLPCGGSFSVPVDEVGVGETIDIVHAEGPFTAHYLEVPSPEGQTLSLTCTGEGVYAAFVALDPDGHLSRMVDGLEPEPTLTVGVPPGGAARAVVVGTRGPLDARCELTRVVPTPPAGCSSAEATPAWLGLMLGLFSLAARRRSNRS